MGKGSLGRIASRLAASALARLSPAARIATAHEHHYKVEFRGPDGNIIAVRNVKNLVVNTGLNDVLDKYYKGSNYTAAHYIGLIDDSPTIAAGDTISSHAGWQEVTDYDVGDSPAVSRATFTPGSVSNQSVDNVGNEAVFNTTDAVDVGGIMLATNSTKGGTTGTLIGAAAFDEGDVSVPSGSTITVTLTATASAA